MDADNAYLSLLGRVLSRGERVRTRNAGVLRVFAEQVTFRRTPLVSARKTAWKNALREMEWFLSGSTNILDLHPSARPWWQPWADELGAVWSNYGRQFRNYGSGFDQIEYLIDGVTNHPFSRRNVITTWHTQDMADPGTPITTCHGTVIQCFVDAQNALHLVTYQRSVDVIVGLPHNWLQYWALLLWLASRCARSAGTLVWVGGDVHVYESHLDLARRIVQVDPPGQTPGLIYGPRESAFRADDFGLDGPYRPVVTERAEMVV